MMALCVKAEPKAVGWGFCDSLWSLEDTRRPSFSMPLVTRRVSGGLPFVIAVLNAAALIFLYLTNHRGHARRCTISDRCTTLVASVRSTGSVGTAARLKPQNVSYSDSGSEPKTLAD